jgi:hypothetical protein
MRNHGQERLRIPIYHASVPRTITCPHVPGTFPPEYYLGTALPSFGGDLPSQYQTNLHNFLTDVQSAGFSEVIIGFFPLEENNPIPDSGQCYNSSLWSGYEDGTCYQENWNLIYNTYSYIDAAFSTVAWRLDLLNEGAPDSTSGNQADYVTQLWNDYNFIFSKTTTLGFSVAEDASRLQNLIDIYDSTAAGRAYLYDVHLYSDPGGDFAAIDAVLDNEGEQNTGVIIGETYFNNPTVASALETAIGLANRTVFYLFQWPITSGSSTINVEATDLQYYGNYCSHGFCPN